MLTSPRVTDQTQRMTGLDPRAGGQLSDHRGIDRRIGLKGELLQALRARETGSADAPFGAATGAVVAFGDHQLGQKR
jgi:hypothetical protein